VNLVTIQTVTGPEPRYLRQHFLLLGLQSVELTPTIRQRAQEADHQGTHGTAALGGGDPGIPVDVVRNRDRNVLHSFTISHFL
jgi:hypothetical protein